MESLLWIEGDRAFIEWNAVARTAAYVGGGYARLAAATLFIPRPLLTLGYRIIAKLRKRLSGPPRHCLLLTPAQQQRFLG